MGIKKKTDGTYRVCYSKRHPITRQPVSRMRDGIKTKAEANRVLGELIGTVSELVKRQTVPTWSMVLEKYLTNLVVENSITKDTIYKREKVLKRHTLPIWQNRFIDEVSTPDIHGLLKESLSESSESHRKFILKGIRGVFQYAMNEGLVNRNPTPVIKFKVNEKIKAVLNEEQILILLRKAQELDWDWYPHYAMVLYGGLRSGEAYALTWDKVNLEKRQIVIDTSWNNRNGFKSTKSGDDRVVEIPRPLIPILAELKLKAADGDFVLPRLAKWDQGEQARQLRLFLKSIGLPEIRFHDLRASWATLLLSKNVAPSKVMAMGGWKDMKTMMIYMRKAGIDIRGATNCLDDMQVHGVETGKLLTFV